MAPERPAAPVPDHVDHVLEQWSRTRPDLDVSPLAVVARLHRLAARLTREIVAVHARHGLSEGEFDVLATLRRAEQQGLAPGELAQHTVVTTGAMSKRLDRLEDAGLVERRRSATDGRGREVALTAAGTRVIDRAFTEHVRNEHRLLAGLDEQDRAHLVALLRQWAASLDEC